jgi:hypothetical protein
MDQRRPNNDDITEMAGSVGQEVWRVIPFDNDERIVFDDIDKTIEHGDTRSIAMQPHDESLNIEEAAGNWKPGKNWEGEKASLDHLISGRTKLVGFIGFLLFVQTIAYVVLGFNQIKTVNDVVLLLGPITNLGATAIGIAIAYYFNQDK